VDTVYLRDGDEIRIGDPNEKQEVLIQIQLGTEFTASLESAEQVTMPPTSNLLDTAPENIPYLIVRFPKGSSRYFSIQQNSIVIGRSAVVNLSLPYRFISARHFELHQTGDDFTITDLHSTNGTLVNNKPLTPDKAVPLPTNTIIRIGDDAFGSSVG